MIELDHLQVYELTLTTQGLLFVGNGKEIPKKEYIYNKEKNTVSFLNEQAFFNLLAQKNLVDLFEHYCMRTDDNLKNFLLQECGLTNEQVKSAILYEVSAGDALDANHTLEKIKSLMRNARQEAYIPGSSVKGAIRTALLFSMMKKEDAGKHALADDKRAAKIPEENYLHTLGIKKDKPMDAVNSIMRGIQVSDSEPISNQHLTLSKKMDSSIYGNTRSIPLCRECIVPGTHIKFRLTLDQSILKGTMTVQTMLNALNDFYNYQQRTYASKFTKPAGSMQMAGKCLMTFGGGAGFFTKSLAYPYLGEKEGLRWTSRQLQFAFGNHQHKNDNIISPRTMKYGQYKNKLYNFGTCEVTIQ